MTRDTRSSPPPQPTRSAGRGDYHLLVIGIDDYTHFDPLKTAVNDAKTIRDVLTTQYGFAKARVTELWNEAATAENIDRAFRAYGENGEKALDEADSLLVYFAGHGSVDSFSEMGAWAPVDARKDTLHGSILNETIKAYLARLAARHVLVISDSCFSGDFFKHREAPQSIGKNDAYMQQALAKNSRQALTSGGLEPVSDDGFDGHSVFAYYLLKALRENTAPYLFPADLHDRVKGGVSKNARQTPRLGHLFGARGEEGGEFVLFRQGEATPPPVRPRPEPVALDGNIWLSDGKNKHGPYTEDALKEMIAAGKTAADTLLWQAGMKDWQEIGTLPEWKGHWAGSPEKLNISCPKCGARYVISASAIPEGGISFACRTCRHTWPVNTKGTAAPAQPETGKTDDDIHRQQLEKEAAKGDAEALFQLGCLQLDGINGRHFKKAALQNFMRAGKKKHPGALCKLGEVFENGRGPSVDLAKAFDFYMRAKDLGYPPAKLAVGRFYLSGINLRGSLESLKLRPKPAMYAGYGMELIKIAAKDGCAEADTELGFCYLTGRFGPRASERAIKHFQRAAGLGDPLAAKILSDPAEMERAKKAWHAKIDRLKRHSWKG